MKKSKALFFIGLTVLLLAFVAYTVFHEQLNSYFLLVGTIPACICWICAAQLDNNQAKKKEH